MPRVLIVGSGTLLADSVSSLLKTEKDLQVSSIAFHTDDEIIKCIALLQPEVIVISETDGLPSTRLVDAIGRRVAAPKFRIIVVQPDSNTMRVCDFVTASHSEDLLRLVRNGIITRTASTSFLPHLRRRLP
jgi:chemotaxis response regulator CheB